MAKQTGTMRVHVKVKDFLMDQVNYPESIGDTLARVLGISLGGDKNERKKKTKKRK